MTPAQKLSSYRNAMPRDEDELWRWFRAFIGIKFGRKAVCVGHDAPFAPIAEQCLRRPPQILILGSRGSGKSMGSGICSHYESRYYPGFSTRILGGSLAQSGQIYSALKQFVYEGGGHLGSDADSIEGLLKQSAKYRNRSETAILAASAKQVRGDHVPTLRLDEVDEIDDDIRQSAMGMNMARDGRKAMVVMTSTWHRPTGPMAKLIKEATTAPAPGEIDKRFPLYTSCVFEVLERCPESRSGPGPGPEYEGCPACQLKTWCHEDRKRFPERQPKAKISDGHYAIDDLIQKVVTTSPRVFAADYLCKGPKADGLWFPRFDPAIHVHASAEYDPNLKVRLSIDSGVETGAVLFQIREIDRDRHHVNVFADFYSNGDSAEGNARAILALLRDRCESRRDLASTDRAGKSRNAVGPVVVAEYERAGLGCLDYWPTYPGSVADQLNLLESFVMDAAEKPWLTIHPRCTHLIAAMQSYIRAGKAPQWEDRPKDPQHPAEDLVDALRGGLAHRYPGGRVRPVQGLGKGLAALAY